MAVLIGANPIGWTNDDLQEIGGDTPLETCLKEAKEAGVVGMEKGHKMPGDGAALKAKLAPFGMDFVGGWYSTELLQALGARGIRGGQGAYRDDKGRGRQCRHRRRDLERHPRRPLEAVVGTSATGKRRLGAVRGEDDRIRRAPCRRRGSGSAIIITWERSSSRSATSTPSWPTPSRRCISCSTPATRAGAAPTRRRSRAPIARGSAMSTARTCAKRRCANRTPATGASSIRS